MNDNNMGSITSRFGTLFRKTEESTAMKIGLDGTGKTTILHKMALKKTVTTIAVPINDVIFNVLDIGGHANLRMLWHFYINKTDVVDSTDLERIYETRQALLTLLEHDNRGIVPIMVLANKQDIQGALTAVEMTKQLYLNNLTGRQWCVHETCAVTGEGLHDNIN